MNALKDAYANVMNKGLEPEFVIKFNDDTVIDSLVNLHDYKAMMDKEI